MKVFTWIFLEARCESVISTTVHFFQKKCLSKIVIIFLKADLLSVSLAIFQNFKFLRPLNLSVNFQFLLANRRATRKFLRKVKANSVKKQKIFLTSMFWSALSRFLFAFLSNFWLRTLVFLNFACFNIILHGVLTNAFYSGRGGGGENALLIQLLNKKSHEH